MYQWEHQKALSNRTKSTWNDRSKNPHWKAFQLLISRSYIFYRRQVTKEALKSRDLTWWDLTTQQRRTAVAGDWTIQERQMCGTIIITSMRIWVFVKRQQLKMQS